MGVGLETHTSAESRRYRGVERMKLLTPCLPPERASSLSTGPASLVASSPDCQHQPCCLQLQLGQDVTAKDKLL